MKDYTYTPTLTMEEYRTIYHRAYGEGNCANSDYTYRRLVREAIAAKRGMTVSQMESANSAKREWRMKRIKAMNRFCA